MDRLKAMANFVRIVDSGSLSAAAEASGQSVASLVRSLAALERHLGTRLLNRTTRRMALTDEGQAYLAWSRRILTDFDEMEAQLEGRDGVVRGRLRITAPVEFGHRYVAPLVNDFLLEHRQISIDLCLDDRILPLLEERLDLAVRIGHLPDSGMIARAVGSTRLITCASAEYLRSAPAPDTPGALHEHACITLAAQGRQWFFQHNDGARAENIVPRLVCSHVRAASMACVQGVGISRLMHYQIAEELADGRLVRVLGAFEPADLPVQLVYPHALTLSPRVKTFVEWAVLQLESRLPAPLDAVNG